MIVLNILFKPFIQDAHEESRVITNAAAMKGTLGLVTRFYFNRIGTCAFGIKD